MYMPIKLSKLMLKHLCSYLCQDMPSLCVYYDLYAKYESSSTLQAQQPNIS